MDCIFCKIANGGSKEKIIYENDNFFSIPDVNPLVEGHSLVISKKHFENILDLPDSLGSEFLDCVKKTSLKLLEEFNAEGFNLINNTKEVAGQVVPHFHLHILPRNKKDGLSLSLREE